MNDYRAGFTIRAGEEKDSELILSMIRELAAFEGLDHEITATAEDIRKSLFEKKQAEVVIGWFYEKPAAFALYFYNYSTFLGKAGLYLEDLFVREEYRKQGLGREMLRYLARTAVENQCERLDWLCLDWNSPAIEFYESFGAYMLDDRRMFRMSGDKLSAFAGTENEFFNRRMLWET